MEMHPEPLACAESLEDAAFVAAFEAGTLGAFHHADHVRLAWLYLGRYPVQEALGRFEEGLKRFAARRGQPHLYHETITWAYLLVIRERLARAEAPETWPSFAERNPDLMRWPSPLLKKLYRDETLWSDLARHTFVMPDRGGG
jgi:N-formylglutamate deformylase